MSKVIAFDVTAPALKPARLVTITRLDGTVARIAEAQNDVTVGADTWSPSGLVTMSAIKHTIDGSVASMEITAALTEGGPFDPDDVKTGRFRDARVVVYVVDRDNPVLGTYFTGIIGRQPYGGPFFYKFEVRGEAARAKGNFVQHFGPMCRTDLGSVLCKIPILPADRANLETLAVGLFRRFRFAANATPDDYADRNLEVTAITTGITAASAPSISSTIGATTVDGGVTWTTRNSWTRWARIAAIEDDGHGIVLNRDVDARAVDGWFNEGAIIYRSGASNSFSEPVARWINLTRKASVYAKMTGLIAVNDWVEVVPGCLKRKVTDCTTKYSNAVNFRGEADFFGADLVVA